MISIFNCQVIILIKGIIYNFPFFLILNFILYYCCYISHEPFRKEGITGLCYSIFFKHLGKTGELRIVLDFIVSKLFMVSAAFFCVLCKVETHQREILLALFSVFCKVETHQREILSAVFSVLCKVETH